MIIKKELPVRKKIRLEGYDYSSSGAYFVTICTNTKYGLLWKSVGADSIRPSNTNGYDVLLSSYGEIIEKAIKNISVCYSNVEVDRYCIMPDHLHLILFITSDDSGRIISAPTLSGIIGQMKRWVSKQLGFSIWQKSFYENIIKNEKAYREMCKYIYENPLKYKSERIF